MEKSKYLWHVIGQKHADGMKWIVRKCTRKSYERRLKYYGEDFMYYTDESAARAEADRRNALGKENEVSKN